MKAIMMGLLTAILTTSAYADVSIVQSKINGAGYKTIGSTVNILSPSITLDGQTYELHVGAATAKSACEMLGLDYLDYQKGSLSLAKRVRLNGDGAIEFVDSNFSLGVLSCKIRK